MFFCRMSVILIKKRGEKMLKIAICDDEPRMGKELSDRLSKYMAERNRVSYSVHSFVSGRDLLESGGDFDLIFLDIQMEGPDGMETAKRLRQRGQRGLIIFVTVLKECVYDAFEVEACDYLLKPLDGARFRKALERALKTIEERAAKSILIRRGTSCEVVLLAQIVYCEVQGRKIYIHQSEGTVVDYYDRLEDLERRLDRRFFKCHRSYLVNLDFVRGCSGGQVLLPQGEAIPVSRLRERGLTQALLLHMKERDF